MTKVKQSRGFGTFYENLCFGYGQAMNLIKDARILEIIGKK